MFTSIGDETRTDGRTDGHTDTTVFFQVSRDSALLINFTPL